MGKDFTLVINQASPNKAAKITSAVMTSLSHDGPIMPTAIAARMDHQYAYALGQGSLEYPPAAWIRRRSPRARSLGEVVAVQCRGRQLGRGFSI